MALTPTGYARARIKKQTTQTGFKKPVVTISREVGCPAKVVTSELVKQINKSAPVKWSCISKEILKESARNLSLPPADIKHFFKYHEQGVFDGILHTMSKFYVSDRKIYTSIEKAIQGFADLGHVVIVGRAGAAICQDHENALHIKLVAPVKWRLSKIMEYHKLKEKEARKYIEDYDYKRKKFLSYYLKEDPNLALYDVTFNCESFSLVELTDSIHRILNVRKMI